MEQGQASSVPNGTSTDTPSAQRHSVAQLWQWADLGFLRRLDAAFAQWLTQQDPTCDPALPYVAAVLAAREGAGHSCLVLDRPPEALVAHLSRPTANAEAADEAAVDPLHARMLAELLHQLPRTPDAWRKALQSVLVEVFSTHGTGLVSATPPQLSATAGGAENEEDEKDKDGLLKPPLVLHVDAMQRPQRLYLRRYHRYEQVVAAGLLQRVDSPPISAEKRAEVRRVLDGLFDSEDQQTDSANWQKIACALALRQPLAVITGGPGTGKTYTAARLIAAVLALAEDPAKLQIRLAAPTGKAAARLSESLQLALQDLPHALLQKKGLNQALAQIPPARTLHALLGARPNTLALRQNAGNPLALDWLFVDEASMVDLQMMAALLEAMPPHAHLVLLGDKDQLDSVEAGAVLGDVCTNAAGGLYSDDTADYVHASTGCVVPAELVQPASAAPPALAQCIAMLRKSQRFGGTIGNLAQAVQNNDSTEMERILAELRSTSPEQRAVFWKEGASASDAEQLMWATPASTAMDGWAPLLSALKTAPVWPLPPLQPEQEQDWHNTHAKWVGSVLAALGHFRILCATRTGKWGVEGMNQLVMQRLQQEGLTPREQGWFAGRVVIVNRNDAATQVFNGDVGIALPSPHRSRPLRVYFAAAQAPGELARSVAVSRLPHVDTAFAMTVHKSQGSEFAHVMLCFPGVHSALLSRELLYTGLTRAKQRLSYLCPGKGIWRAAMAQPTQRDSGLAHLLHTSPSVA